MNVIEDRATKLGEYIVENKATVRRAAKQFGISKSTVHTDVTKVNDAFHQSLSTDRSLLFPVFILNSPLNAFQ